MNISPSLLTKIFFGNVHRVGCRGGGVLINEVQRLLREIPIN